jgi:predicted PurR-regulated permease PerM
MSSSRLASSLSRDPAPVRADPTARTLRWIALGVLAILVLHVLGDVLLVLFAACLLAVVMQAASRLVARRTGIGRPAALGILLAVAAIVIGLFAWLGVGNVTAQAANLAVGLQERLASLRQALSGTGWGNAVIGRAGEYLSGGHVAGMASGIATSTLGVAGTLVVLLASAIYIAISPQMYRDGVVRLLPLSVRPRAQQVIAALGETLVWWFIGQLCDMLVVGSLTFIGLWALGVPLAGTLAVIAAMFNFVPYIGAISGAVPAVLVAVGQSTTLALEVGGLFVVVQALEGNVIAPLIQRRTIELPPLLTIFAQTVFGTLFGIGGLILATPIAAALLVLVRMVYVEDVLGDRQAQD